MVLLSIHVFRPCISAWNQVKYGYEGNGEGCGLKDAKPVFMRAVPGSRIRGGPSGMLRVKVPGSMGLDFLVGKDSVAGSVGLDGRPIANYFNIRLGPPDAIFDVLSPNGGVMREAVSAAVLASAWSRFGGAGGGQAFEDRPKGTYLRNVAAELAVISNDRVRVKLSDRLYADLALFGRFRSTDLNGDRLFGPACYDYLLPDGPVDAYRGPGEDAKYLGVMPAFEILARAEALREQMALRILSLAGPGRQVWLDYVDPGRIRPGQGLNGETVVEVEDFESDGHALVCVGRGSFERMPNGSCRVYLGREFQPVDYYLTTGDLGLRLSFRTVGELVQLSARNPVSDKSVQGKQYGEPGLGPGF